jgi:hypothetical protein
MKATSGDLSAGFAELTGCETGDCFENVADEYPDSPVGMWARLRAAEQYLDDGIRASTSNRNASHDSLQRAKDAFDRVLKGENVPPQARERALFGMGVCLETLSNENTGPAIEAYESLLGEFKESQYRYLAEDRIAALKTSRAQEFYAWFHAQNPRPEDRPGPRDRLDFLRNSDPETPPGGDDGSGLPPPPPSAEPQTSAPSPPTDPGSGPSLPQQSPPDAAPGTPESSSGTTPDGAAADEKRPASSVPEDQGSAAPAGETQP